MTGGNGRVYSSAVSRRCLRQARTLRLCSSNVSAKACPPVQDGLAARLLGAAGALDKWIHRYVQARNLIDKLNTQISALANEVAQLTEQSTARVLKDGIASAVKQLRIVQDDLNEVGSVMFVCMQALQTKSGDDES